jgi:hypothetical protein
LKVLALTALLCFLACSSSPKMTPLMEHAGVKDMTAAELRMRMHEFAVRYPVLIEEAAYRIESGTADPEIWKQALLWKIYAIPAYHKAMFRLDPYAALMDTWVLTVQMRDYFEEGAGARAFGDGQAIVLGALDGMETELISIAELALGEEGIAATRRDVYGWAEEHPARTHFFIRDSVVPLVAGVMSDQKQNWTSGFESLEESVQELRMRLTIYTDIIPRQVQWQLELASLGLMEAEDIQAAFQDISELRGVLADMETSLDGGFERTSGSVDGVDKSISGGFDRLGMTLIEGIRGQRIEAVAGLRGDLEPVLADLQKIVDEGAADYEKRTRSVVDHAFWRGLILIAAFFVGLAAYRISTRSRK